MCTRKTFSQVMMYCVLTFYFVYTILVLELTILICFTWSLIKRYAYYKVNCIWSLYTIIYLFNCSCLLLLNSTQLTTWTKEVLQHIISIWKFVRSYLCPVAYLKGMYVWYNNIIGQICIWKCMDNRPHLAMWMDWLVISFNITSQCIYRMPST